MRVSIIPVLLISLLPFACRRAHCPREQNAGGKTFEVLAARGEISPDTHITRWNTQVRQLPEAHHFDTMIPAHKFVELESRRIRHRLAPGQPITWADLDPRDPPRPFSSRIRKKGRTLTLSSREISGLSDVVAASDHVDIIGFFNHKGIKGVEPRAVTLLENIIVLKVTHGLRHGPGGLTERDDRVTLLLLPEEVELLSLGRGTGQLTLSLRNAEDLDVQSPKAWTTPKTLFGGERTKAPERIRRLPPGFPTTMPQFRMTPDKP